jgi:transposase
MAASRPTSVELPADLRLESRPAQHSPLIAAVVDAIGITDVFETALPMDPRSTVSHADCVKVMIANILCGRCALLAMPAWLAQVDAEQLFTPGATPEMFNDQRLASTLDHIHRVGTDNLMSLVATGYLQAEPQDGYIVLLDHTSLSLWGDYDSAHQLALPRPAYGYSKAYKPHLKQLLFGMSLAGSANVPVTASMVCGNTAESKANRLQLDKIAQLMPDPGSVTLVADCKLVDGPTLRELHRQEIHFVSMLPATYKLRAELIERVRSSGEPLPFALQGPARSKNSPGRTYRAKSFPEPMVIGEKSPKGDEAPRSVTLRFVVVESDDVEPAGGGVVARSVDAEVRRYNRLKKQLLEEEFACEPDAQSAIDKLQDQLSLHSVNLAPVQVSKPVKREGPGRPPKDEVREYRTFVQVQELAPPEVSAERVERDDFHARHFVLVTDHLEESEWPDERVLREYRSQQVIEGHTGFRWLKNVALVAPIFLHLPTRIAALGLIFARALMVRNYIPATIRAGLTAQKAAIPDRLNRPTQKPTMETAMRQLATASTTTIFIGDRKVEKRVQGLTEAGRLVLSLLGLDEDIYLKPPGSRKWGRVCHGMGEM